MSQFCPHAEKAKRCVLYVGHIGQHDLQGLGSASVKAIMSREALEERLGHNEFLRSTKGLQVETPTVSDAEELAKQGKAGLFTAPDSNDEEGNTTS